MSTTRQAESQLSRFSQGSAATFFRLGWRVYKFLMSNFLRILYTESY